MSPLWLMLGVGAVFSQVPSWDSRDAYVPDTKTHFVMKEYATLSEWETRKAQLRGQILAAAGLFPMPVKTDLHPQVFGRLEHEDYAIEKVLLETLPGYYLGGNLYRPLKAGRFPGVLSPHGHWKHGRLENETQASVPARCINLARQGYVVLAYDMVGYNDTKQTPHSFGGKAEQLWSFSPLGLQLWNSIRVADFLSSLPYVKPGMLAATGASGGGTQTFLLTAVDDRIGYSAPVNMISSVMQGGCVCENAPNLRLETFNVEIAAMMAPRPMLMVSATGDWTANTPKEEFPGVQSIYRLYGQPGNVEMVQMDAGHNYNKASREAVYRFFGLHILDSREPEELAERDFTAEKDEDMLALSGGRSLPVGALNFDGIFQYWKTASQLQISRIRDRKALKQVLSMAFASEWPTKVWNSIDGQKIVLSRLGRGDRVPGLWFPGTGNPVLVVHDGGSGAARHLPAVEKLIRQKRPLLLVDAFQRGEAVKPRNENRSHFLTFNQTDDAIRVQDILTALQFLKSETRGKIELIGSGRGGVWSLFATALAPIEVKLTADLEGFRGTDEDFARHFFVPGIQRAGGLETALMLTRQRRSGMGGDDDP